MSVQRTCHYILLMPQTVGGCGNCKTTMSYARVESKLKVNAASGYFETHSLIDNNTKTHACDIKSNWMLEYKLNESETFIERFG